ncbi:hypothetical protein EZ456_08410 [Pedobacter psychrodurus]|uniref:TonB C-terminal domain-containing protein n=1 Tax=Pedobacter psychrodurus TaxID=2530456 RepID=A0A4R0Q5Q2_9SPHI|nr:hypothetical protein [Pedobacter psychrodurus]TCD27957.1 hypothetical protein EZ456_08410 [Pedobacter psychrodurus]
MLKLTLLFAFLLTAFNNNSIDHAVMNNNPSHTDCTQKKDLITGKMIYTSFDEPATNQGGRAKLYKALSNVTLETIPNSASTQFTISFLVDADGRISRERVVRDEVGKIGEQMLKIIKSFKWAPATCNGKKVATLTTLSTRMCLQ